MYALLIEHVGTGRGYRSHSNRTGHAGISENIAIGQSPVSREVSKTSHEGCVPPDTQTSFPMQRSFSPLASSSCCRLFLVLHGCFSEGGGLDSVRVFGACVRFPEQSQCDAHAWRTFAISGSRMCRNSVQGRPVAGGRGVGPDTSAAAKALRGLHSGWYTKISC